MRVWLETFPNRLRPPVSFAIAADMDEDVVVSVSTLAPGSMDFIRVSRLGGDAKFVAEDQLRYRPRGLK